MSHHPLSPSAHIAELFFPRMTDDSQVAEIVERIGESGFYRWVETGIVTSQQASQRIHRSLQQQGLQLTQWMTFELLKENLDLCSLESSLRMRSVHRAKELVHLAAACGTRKLSVVSGRDPGAERREEAKRIFGDALCEIAEEMRQYPQMILQVEPLDRFAHKCQLIGPTDETVRWMAALRQSCPALYLAWDSAHTALNEEDLHQSLQQSAGLISQLHLANAITRPQAEGYGDYHMKFGAPGFLTPQCAADIVRTARSLTYANELADISIAVEMRTTESDDLWDNERQCREFLQAALAQG